MLKFGRANPVLQRLTLSLKCHCSKPIHDFIVWTQPNNRNDSCCAWPISHGPIPCVSQCMTMSMRQLSHKPRWPVYQIWSIFFLSFISYLVTIDHIPSRAKSLFLGTWPRNTFSYYWSYSCLKHNLIIRKKERETEIKAST